MKTTRGNTVQGNDTARHTAQAPLTAGVTGDGKGAATEGRKGRFRANGAPPG